MPAGIIPACTTCPGYQKGTVQMYSYICRWVGWHRTGLDYAVYYVFCTGIFVFLVLRVRTVLILFCFRTGRRCVCAGCIAGFLPKRSRLPDAPAASSIKSCLLSSFWMEKCTDNVMTCFGLLSICCCAIPTRPINCLQPTQWPISSIVHERIDY